MSKIAKLKKQALEFEQKKQFDKALARYMLALQAMEESKDEADVALYNRVGDLLLRQGSVAEAVDHYEKAVDLYAESGLFNNAIALCNKILRNAPGRSSVYYKLGKISAQKGFTSDARQNYLEYAGRMERAGERAEAFRALQEFSELCPDQEDIRQLVEKQIALDEAGGTPTQRTRENKAQADAKVAEPSAAERAKTAELEAQQRRAAGLPTPKSSELVFLDLGDDFPAAAPARAPVPRPSPSRRDEPLDGGGPSVELPFIDAPAPAAPAPAAMAAPAASAAPAPGAAELDPVELEYFERSAPPAPAAPAVIPMPDLIGTADVEATGTAPADHASAPELLAPADLIAPATPPAPGTSSPAVGEVPGLQQGASEEFVGGAALPPEIEVPAYEPPAHEPAPIPVVELPPELAPVAPPSAPVFAAPEAAEAPPTAEPDPAPSIDADLQALQDLSTPITPAHHEAQTPSPAVPNDDLPLLLSDSLAMPAATGPAAAPAEPPPPPVYSDDEPLIIIRESERDGGLGWDDLAARADAALSDLTGSTYDPAPAPVPARPVKARPLAAASPTPTLSPLKRRLESVRARLGVDPQNWDLHRELGELLIEDGDRAGGLAELEAAMTGFERAGDPSGARSLAEEILRLEPDSVRYHQKRVEYAFRSNDKPRLVDAYLELADCLMRDGELEKARSVYARVRELSPADSRADAALGAVGGAHGGGAPLATGNGAPPAGLAVALGVAGRPGASGGHAATPPPQQGGDYVDLSAWLFEDERPKSTRMIVYGVTEPEEGKQADFEEMLEHFKRGVAASIDEGDHESHYDLGIAYREMGLLDEAIAELQKALRTTGDRVRTYEALGQCFVDKGQYQVAAALLTHALADGTGGDQMLVGILYLLGVSCEALQRWADARSYYERVFAIDLQFRDVRERLAAAERAVT